MDTNKLHDNFEEILQEVLQQVDRDENTKPLPHIPKEIIELVLEHSNRDNNAEKLPHIPAEIVHNVLDHLDEVQDLANVAQVSREFRSQVNHCENCWKKVFLRSFGECEVAKYSAQPTWRSKFLACMLEQTCSKLRDKAEQFEELEDASIALERVEQDVLRDLKESEDSLNKQRMELNAKLEIAIGREGVHYNSPEGRYIIQTARIDAADAHDRGESTVCADLAQSEVWSDVLSAVDSMEQWARRLQERKDVLRTLIEAHAYRQDASRKVAAAIDTLRARRASLQQATASSFTG